MTSLVTKERLILALLLAAGIIAGMTAPRVIDAIKRYAYGVAPDVVLEGYQVGRLFPAEVEVILEEVDKKLGQPPSDAFYDQTQNRVVPETIGKAVNRERTLEAVLSAKRGSQVNAVLEPIVPPITHSYFQPVFRGDLSRKAIALMINVAWGNEYISAMLQVLGEHRVKATFFFIGTWVERFPGLFSEIVKAGHEIANHGYIHGHPNQMSEQEISQLITKAQAVMEKTGAAPVRVFAPPAGEYNQKVVRVAAGLGYRTVLWTIDTVDWKRPAPDVIVERVVKKAQNGAFVLMHPTEPTLAALPRIISALTEQGYELVTVSELL